MTATTAPVECLRGAIELDFASARRELIEARGRSLW
jgi:hypothetical protein